MKYATTGVEAAAAREEVMVARAAMAGEMAARAAGEVTAEGEVAAAGKEALAARVEGGARSTLHICCLNARIHRYYKDTIIRT